MQVLRFNRFRSLLFRLSIDNTTGSRLEEACFAAFKCGSLEEQLPFPKAKPSTSKARKIRTHEQSEVITELLYKRSLKEKHRVNKAITARKSLKKKSGTSMTSKGKQKSSSNARKANKPDSEASEDSQQKQARLLSPDENQNLFCVYCNDKYEESDEEWMCQKCTQWVHVDCNDAENETVEFLCYLCL
ncbi:hypothetical protein FQR65_LT08115 [Abscondita terminalis]|nr:hypothetical protein FQR65_LT08115 [Abscondita terminalis]